MLDAAQDGQSDEPTGLERRLFQYPSNFVRLQMAWPLEGSSGQPRFSMVLGRWHDFALRR